MMSIERVPEVGTKPVSLVVKLPPSKTTKRDILTDGLRELYQRGEFTDVNLVCADRSFGAHRVVLASKSEAFKQGLNGGKETEVRFVDISNPEAVKFMLDYIYQMESVVLEDYNPRTQEINKDVLRLGQKFGLQGLIERATHWMAKDLTTGNVVERLKICEDFNLTSLKEKILEQLALNKRALSEIACSPQIVAYPKLMQALLQQAAMASEAADTAAPKKRGRAA